MCVPSILLLKSSTKMLVTGKDGSSEGIKGKGREGKGRGGREKRMLGRVQGFVCHHSCPVS